MREYDPNIGYGIHTVKITLAIGRIEMPDDVATQNGTIAKAKRIEVLAINEDGNIVSIFDEGWRFQFLPIIGRAEGGCSGDGI